MEHYPSASFDTKAIPELKDAKDGEHHHILIKFKKTGRNSDNNRTMVHGDMVAAKYVGKGKGMNKKDEPEDQEETPAQEKSEHEKD